jgi:penicillin amidase
LYEDLSKPGLQTVLKTALEKAASDFEKYPTWGKLHYLRLRHPLGNIPLVGGPYRFGEYPAPGSTNTVMKRAHPLINEKHYTTYGANARHISDLADMDENYFVLVGGQDGHIGSENFLDLFELWQNGRYIRVPLRLETVRRTFEHHMVFSAGQPF